MRTTESPIPCPSCRVHRNGVTNTRATDSGRMIRRRRQCAACGHRWTTYEGDVPTLKQWLLSPLRDLRMRLFEAEETIKAARSSLSKSEKADLRLVQP